MATIEKIPSLNGIRAASVTAVILAHSGFQNIIPGGFGVTVFFFLSGYLITTLFLNEASSTGGINVSKFYLRRIIRLFPPMLIIIFLSYLLVIFGILGGEASVIGALSQVFYFANYFNIFFEGVARTPAGTNILWSLSVEEHYYFVYPLLFSLLLINLDRKKFLSILILVVISVLFWRYYLFHNNLYSDGRILFASDTRIDSIIFGCILAKIKNPALKKINLPPKTTDIILFLIAVILILLCFLIRNEEFRLVYRFSLQGAALCILFYYSIAYHMHPIFHILNSKVAEKIGLYSYTMYLVHYILIALARKYLPYFDGENNFQLFACIFVVSYFFSWSVYVIVEKPLVRYRKQYR